MDVLLGNASCVGVRISQQTVFSIRKLCCASKRMHCVIYDTSKCVCVCEGGWMRKPIRRFSTEFPWFARMTVSLVHHVHMNEFCLNFRWNITICKSFLGFPNIFAHTDKRIYLIRKRYHHWRLWTMTTITQCCSRYYREFIAARIKQPRSRHCTVEQQQLMPSMEPAENAPNELNGIPCSFFLILHCVWKKVKFISEISPATAVESMNSKSYQMRECNEAKQYDDW